MKKLLLFTMLVIGLTSYGQLNINSPNFNNIVLKTKHYYKGLIVTTTGGVIMYLGSELVRTDEYKGRGLMLLGSLISAVGTGMMLESFSRGRRTGLTFNQFGVGLIVRL